MSVKVMNKGAKAPDVKVQYYAAHIEGRKRFVDGDMIKIVFDEDIYTSSGPSRKGYGFKAQGWIIDDRVFIDLNMGHELEVLGGDNRKGIPLSQVSRGKKINVILKQLEERVNQD